MMGQEFICKIGEVKFAGDENPYLAAFLSLKYQLLMVEELNAIVPQAIKSFTSKKETFSNTLNILRQKLGEGDIKERKDLNELLDKFKQQSEVFKKIKEILKQAESEVKSKGMKEAFLGVDEKTAVGKTILDGIRYDIFPKQFITFIRNMSLVYLVALFESYLGQVLQITMQKEPKILMTSQKNITYEELLTLDDIEDAKKQIIEREIAIVNEDLDKLARYFEDKFNMRLTELSEWSQFKERFCRRNIIIHNSGYPNKPYRQKTGYKGKNKKMDVSEKYLRYSIELFGKLALAILVYFTGKFIRKTIQ
jgi:hypothetical protein